VSLLLSRGALPPPVRPAAEVVLTATITFLAAFTFAAASGIGLIVPALRLSRIVVGARRAERAAREVAPVEDVIIRFLHTRRRRLAEVLAIEAAAHMLLMAEVAVVFAALGLLRSWSDPLIVEGGVKFITVAFAFIPGEAGAAEGVYALLAGAIGLPA